MKIFLQGVRLFVKFGLFRRRLTREQKALQDAQREFIELVRGKKVVPQQWKPQQSAIEELQRIIEKKLSVML